MSWRVMERAPLLAVQEIDQRFAEAGGRGRDSDAGRLHRRDLVLGAPFASGDNRASVPHAPPGRGGAAGDEADDWLRAAVFGFVGEKRGGVLLRLAADFPD